MRIEATLEERGGSERKLHVRNLGGYQKTARLSIRKPGENEVDVPVFDVDVYELMSACRAVLESW